MRETLKNAWKILELRKKILYTLGMLLLYRVLCFIPTPGVDPETSWIGDKYERTDDRAVDEYCAMARENGHQVANKTYLLGSENDVLGPTLYWALGNGTPIEIVEAAREAWQHRCNLFNGDETEEDYQKYLDEKAAAEAAAAEAAAAEAAAEEAPAE